MVFEIWNCLTKTLCGVTVRWCYQLSYIYRIQSDFEFEEKIHILLEAKGGYFLFDHPVSHAKIVIHNHHWREGLVEDLSRCVIFFKILHMYCFHQQWYLRNIENHLPNICMFKIVQHFEKNTKQGKYLWNTHTAKKLNRTRSHPFCWIHHHPKCGI